MEAEIMEIRCLQGITAKETGGNVSESGCF